MIERTLLYPAMPVPYLGEARVAEAGARSSPAAANFHALTQTQTVSEKITLQSTAHHLKISIETQTKTVTHPSAQKLEQMSQQASQLSQTTQAHIQKHPVYLPHTLGEQEFLLLLALRGNPKNKVSDQLVPSPFAMLSFIETERRYLKTLPKSRKLNISGVRYMRFQFFDWESEEQPPQRKQAQPDSEAD